MNNSIIRGLLILSSLSIMSCAKPDDQKQLIEKAKVEGQQQAQADFDKQMAEKDALIQRARDEARAQAEEDFKVRLENQAKLIEQARSEGRAQAEEQLSVENGGLSTKAIKMEQDLAGRHQFYQALAGTYEGELTTEQGKFNIRITLVPSLSPLPVDRVRQLEEISSDINNLYLNAQIVQWSADNTLSSVGCRVSQIRPDLINGTLSIASPECSNLYLLKIASKKARSATTQADSKDTTKLIRQGKIKLLPSLLGEVRPTTNSAIYSLYANRKGEGL